MRTLSAEMQCCHIKTRYDLTSMHFNQLTLNCFKDPFILQDAFIVTSLIYQLK